MCRSDRDMARLTDREDVHRGSSRRHADDPRAATDFEETDSTDGRHVTPGTRGMCEHGSDARRWRRPGIRPETDPWAAYRCEKLAGPGGCTNRDREESLHAAWVFAARHRERCDLSMGTERRRARKARHRRTGPNSNRARSLLRCSGDTGSEVDGRTVVPPDRSNTTTRDISFGTCSDASERQRQTRCCAKSMSPNAAPP